MSADVAGLIIRALSGDHLHGFLPGNDRRRAVSAAIASRHHWGGPGGFGEIGRDGICQWPRGVSMVGPRRRDAALFVTWDQVLAIIERGCSGGHRQAYDEAYQAWNAGVRRAYEGWRPGADWFPETPDPAQIHATTAALIRHGCETAEVQGELFELAEVSP